MMTGLAKSPDDRASVPPAGIVARSIGGSTLLSVIVGWLALDQILLLRFLGIASPGLLLAGIAGSGLLIVLVHKGAQRLGPIPLGRVIICLAVAFAILLLGGEGRLFYANIDWQVRDAVLRDMAIHPWPFAYMFDGQPTLLRAPIGMYLLPAVAWKAGGFAAGTVMLVVQNTILLGCLLALGSLLFETAQGRILALVTMLAFGGIDIIGVILSGRPFVDHLEGWSPGLQYSSNITLAFWVPQHAVAGWLAGLLYLLHRNSRLELGSFLAVLPLTALWSPLALIGALPWATLAGIQSLMAGRLRIRDIAIPGVATLLVLPALAYLSAAGDNVGIRPYLTEPWLYMLSLEIEVLPWLIPAIALRARSSHGKIVLFLMAAILALLPLVQIGWSNDLMMRGAIPSQAILGLLTADVLARTPDWHRRGWHWYLSAMLALSAITGLFEIRRAIILPAVGGGTCTFFKAWDQKFSHYPKGSYLASINKVPSWLVGRDVALVPIVEPERCWTTPWIPTSGV